MILFKEEISVAKNLNEFINIACAALQNTLNSEVGQELVQKLLNKKLAENPNMTKNEWNKTGIRNIYVFHTCKRKIRKLCPKWQSLHTKNLIRRVKI